MRYFVFFALLFFTVSTYAADGAFDLTFGNGGRTNFAPAPNENYVVASREMADGRLLIAGNCSHEPCLVRLKPDGSLDTTYGPLHTGTAIFNQFSSSPDEPAVADMILLADGRAVLAGCLGSEATLFVVRADGSDFDTSIANNSGIFTIAPGKDFSFCANRVAQQQDGKFVVLEEAYDPDYGDYVLVTRVKADLSAVDSSFGSGGQSKIAFSANTSPDNSDAPTALAIQADGSIVTGGYGEATNSNYVMEFARLLPNGQLDSTFGDNGDGRLVHSAGSARSTTINDIAITPDQRIVFGGSFRDTSDPNNYFEMVGRLTSAGALDKGFAGGFAAYEPANKATGGTGVQRVLATADSVIAVAFIPRANDSNYSYVEVSRLDRSGNKVPDFGGQGSSYASFALEDDDDFPNASLLTTRGLVVTGAYFDLTTGINRIGAARFQYEHIFGDSFQ